MLKFMLHKGPEYMSVFHLKPTYSNFKVSDEGLRKGCISLLWYISVQLKHVLYSPDVLVNLHQPSEFDPRHTPGWFRASTGHVASNPCSVHTDWVSVLDIWLKAFVATSNWILNYWPKSALKQPAHDSAKLLYMEWRFQPLLLFFSSILFLLYLKKSKPGKFLPLLGLPSQSCCKLFTFVVCNFF